MGSYTLLRFNFHSESRRLLPQMSSYTVDFGTDGVEEDGPGRLRQYNFYCIWYY
jgi:hypothetical protein